MGQINYFELARTTGLLPITRTNIQFAMEGIDYKYKMMDAPLHQERNLNKLRQALSLFHNYHSLSVDKPRIKKGLAEIERVTSLTKGMRSHQWIEEQLRAGKVVGEKHSTLEYDLKDPNTQLYPYMIFKYLITQLNKEVFSVYYELSVYKGFDPVEEEDQRVNGATINIITAAYVFRIVAYDFFEDDPAERRTAGNITIEQVDGNREQIADLVKHPLEIIKTAASKTDYNYLRKGTPCATEEEECETFEKWFTGIRLRKQYDIFGFCEEYQKAAGSEEGIRITIDDKDEKTIMLLRSLYSYTLKTPESFKATNNCIGFRWRIASKAKNGAAYNLIIDRDFRYIYIFNNFGP